MKRLIEIRSRKKEIRTLLMGGGDCDLAKIQTELDALEVEEKNIELRSKMASQLNDGDVAGFEFERPEMRSGQKDIEKMDSEELFASVEYRSAYLKDLQGKPLNEVEKRAMLTVSNNAAVVPTQTLNKIIEKLRQVSVIFPMVTSLNIASNVSIPVENANTDASWVAEATSSTDGADLTTSTISLTAYKLIKTLEISANVEAMSLDAFENFIVTALSNKVKIAVDAAIISGNGTTQAQGIITAVTPIETAANTGWTYADVLALLAALPSMYANNAVIVINRTTLYTKIAAIVDENKRPIFVANAENGFVGKILGIPVITYDALADNKIIFGDFSYYYFNFVKDFGVEKDKSVGFRTGSTVYRAMALCDGKVALPEAFVVQIKKS